MPQLIAAPADGFSPDGDQSAESVSWLVNADATARLLRLRITRGTSVVWTQLLAVTQPGVQTLSWDGADAAGRIVNNGAYGYAIDALGPTGAASTPLRGHVAVNSAGHMVSVWRRQ
jgi:flagellar hook assembly protein FlgD